MSNQFNEIKEIQSSDENVAKFVFTKEDAVAEAVLYKYPTYEERTVICCSTQSGCPVGCRFCGAGDYFVRSLTAEEIVFQVDHLLASKDIDANEIKRFQIMVMSMGEPLLNFKNLAKAFHTLYWKYPNAKLLISTIGPKINWKDVIDLSIAIPTIGLQFSVHESTDEARNKLIPFEAKLTLEEISKVGYLWCRHTGRKPFFNYCVHPGNNTQEDVNRLYNLFDPNIWEATLSVICEREEHVAAANERQRQLTADFMQLMLVKDYSVRMFDPAGQDDIGGGCGQLWFVQDWMKNNPDKTRASCGNGKEVVHTPQVNNLLLSTFDRVIKI